MIIGDRVKYGRKFLKSIFEGPTSEMWHMSGVIRDIKRVGSMSVAVVAWDDGTRSRANVKNLAVTGKEIES